MPARWDCVSRSIAKPNDSIGIPHVQILMPERHPKWLLEAVGEHEAPIGSPAAVTVTQDQNASGARISHEHIAIGGQRQPTRLHKVALRPGRDFKSGGNFKLCASRLRNDLGRIHGALTDKRARKLRLRDLMMIGRTPRFTCRRALRASTLRFASKCQLRDNSRKIPTSDRNHNFVARAPFITMSCILTTNGVTRWRRTAQPSSRMDRL